MSMLIYQNDNKFFIYGVVQSVTIKNKNHHIYDILGYFPIKGVLKERTIPVHIVNNHCNKMLDKAMNANLGIGSKIYMKVSYVKKAYFMNQFLFQGQMKYYQKKGAPERNLYVGKIVKIFELSQDVLCLQMPINQKSNTKWMNLLIKCQYQQTLLERLRPERVQTGIKYKTAAILAGEEKQYNGYYQSNIIRYYF